MRTNILRGTLRGLVASLILVISPILASADDSACPPPPPSLGRYTATVPPQPAPTEAFTAVDGSRRLADFRGRGVVLNFWATWCAPCVREMPALDRLAAATKAKGLAVLALSEDRNGHALVDKFFAVNKIAHLPALVDPQGRVARAARVRGVPTTLLIDAAGNEVGRVVGDARWDDPASLAFLSKCLAPKPETVVR